MAKRPSSPDKFRIGQRCILVLDTNPDHRYRRCHGMPCFVFVKSDPDCYYVYNKEIGFHFTVQEHELRVPYSDVPSHRNTLQD